MHDSMSTRSQKKQSEAAQSDTLRRKRERDKDNQRKKRQREREYTASLEEKVVYLQRQLTTATSHPAASPAPQLDDGMVLSPPISNSTDPHFSEVNRRDHPGHGTSLADSWLDQPRGPRELDQAYLTNSPITTGTRNIGRPSYGKQSQGMQEQQRRPSGATPTATDAASLLDSRSVDIATRRWDLTIDPTTSGHDHPGHRSHHSQPIDGFQHNETFASPHSPESTRSLIQAPVQVVVSTSILADLLQKAEWLRIPQHTYASGTCASDLDLPFARLFASTSEQPDLLASCDEIPKVLDIMFGGSSNFLANAIHDQTGHDPTLPPERFAIGWLLYLYTRWLAAPTEASYSRVPAHFRPTAIQLVQPHSPSVDMILWPQMRENIIKYGSKFVNAQVFGLLACTCRIRGGFNRNFTTRSNDQDPEIEESFLRKITSLEGWGILERFWDVYPELVEGLDPSIMIKEEQLIPS